MNVRAAITPAETPQTRSPSPRQFWVRLHRYAGLFIALFLIVASITGTLIAFYNELDRALNPELYRIVERSGPPLSAEAIAQKVKAVYPDAFINLMTLNRAAGESVRVRLTPLTGTQKNQPFVLPLTEIFIDPFDGHILGGRERGAFRADRAHLMPFIYRLHYTLAIVNPWGEWLMGIVALIWLLDCFVGFYITLPANSRSARAPRKSWWQRWKPAWLIKLRASTTRITFDLHRASGLWFWLVLMVMALTSVYFNLTNEVFRPVLGAIAPLSPEQTVRLQQSPQATLPAKLTFDEAIARAQTMRSSASQMMEPSYIGLTPNAPGIYRFRFADTGRGDINWHFHYENLFLDGASGDLVLRVNYDNGTAADRFILWQYPLHSGQIFGFWGRVFIAATGIVGVVLSITGVMLWLKKR